MVQFWLLLPFLAASLAHAADSSVTHSVSVGANGELKYSPEYINAEIGDKIVFTFNPKNHTATQSSFNDPCSPLPSGFDSGFRPVAAGTTYGLPTFTVDVKDKNPIWVYCRQPGPPRHCTQGMVFAVNAPTSGNTFAAFQKKALALDTSTTSTSAPPASTSPTVYEVSVGANGLLRYDPENVNAKPGEKIRFTFHQKAHSATQSAFDTPCSPLSSGFDSGLQPVAANVTSGFPTYTITVNDTKPIWVYCKQPGPPAHCPKGMVFAANPPTSGNTFAAFQKKALALDTSTTSTSAPPAASTSPTVYEVSVGANGLLRYDPENVNAKPGEKIRFTFHQKAHSATQSAFDTPCSPLSSGFDSGLQPVAANVTSGFPTYTITVNDTKPIWVYCKQPGPPAHCPKGMVFAANPPTSGNTFAAFQKKALALDTSTTSTSASPASTSPAVYEVSVGANGLLKYDPENVNAKPGDKIRFTFHQKAHSATQSAFDTPCSPLSSGFDSGLQPVAANVTSGFPTYTITVNDTKPIWVYCKQPGPPAHCPKGMVFAANPPTSGNTFAAFQKKALALDTSSSSKAASATSTHIPPASSTSSAYKSSTCGPAQPLETYPFHPPPVTHKVIVGGDAGNVFTPNSVDAAPGDYVLFEFQKTNHSVTQSSFNDPCTKLETSTNGYLKGFDSGFHPVAAGTTNYTTFQIKVNDTTPIWGYCRQTGHCLSGMAFGINAPKYGPHTIGAFLELAKHSNATTLTADYSSAKPIAGY